MKNISIVVVILVLFSSMSVSASTINLNINGMPVEFDESSGIPFIDGQNRTQVPFRIALEKFGAEVIWNAEERIAIATKNGIEVRVPIGQKYIYKNGEKIENDTAALIRNGRTYLPIRVVMEAFGMDVSWDAGTSSVMVNQIIIKDQPKVIIYSAEW